MDHDRYEWSMLTDRKPVQWPNGKSLALWVNVSLEHFPLNPTGKPVKLPGSMTMPYPDLRHYTLRDYGNRVGVYRFFHALDKFGVKPTFAMNACLSERYPQLVAAVISRGDEVIGHSWSMDTTHAGEMTVAVESELISRTLDSLRTRTKQPILGWLSPGKLETANTPDLLKSNGIDYFCDWVNDDMPYAFHTAHGDLLAMPLSTEIEDRFVILDNFQSEESWADQVTDACDFLLAEGSAQNGRILSLSVHPWVLGQPHRMKHFERVLADVMSRAGVWSASAGEIANAFTSSQST
jgi:peptidoglycan/xylan/chitin deacetylase (PgdA/CDA1 family)